FVIPVGVAELDVAVDAVDEQIHPAKPVGEVLALLADERQLPAVLGNGHDLRERRRADRLADLWRALGRGDVVFHVAVYAVPAARAGGPPARTGGGRPRAAAGRGGQAAEVLDRPNLAPQLRVPADAGLAPAAGHHRAVRAGAPGRRRPHRAGQRHQPG